MSIFSIFSKKQVISKNKIVKPRNKPPNTLALYKLESCIFCRRVMALIEKHHLPVTYLDIRKHPEYRQDLLRMNGKGQVPCLMIDDEPLLESEDIVRYLKKSFNL